jgi:hypothetical protein
MKFLSQIFYKWILIFFLFKRLLLKFYANEFLYICFAQEPLFLNSLQNGTHVFFSQNLYETTSYRSNPLTNQICSKLHKINTSLKLHQKKISLNKFITSQPNWFKSTKFEALVWNQPCFGSIWVIMCDGVVLDCIFIFYSFCLWWIACRI